MEQREGRYSFYSSQLLATLFHHHSSDNKALAKERYFGIECWDEASATPCSSLPGIAGKLPFVALCLGMTACMCMSVCLSVCPSVCLSVHPSVCMHACTVYVYANMQIYCNVQACTYVCICLCTYQDVSRVKAQNAKTG